MAAERDRLTFRIALIGVAAIAPSEVDQRNPARVDVRAAKRCAFRPREVGYAKNEPRRPLLGAPTGCRDGAHRRERALRRPRLRWAGTNSSIRLTRPIT